MKMSFLSVRGNYMRQLLINLSIVTLFVLSLSSCTPSPRYTATQQKRTQDKAPKTKSKKVSGKHKLSGGASWYGKKYHGRTTASGERYNMYAMTAAHKTLPFGTRVKVTDLATGRTVVVTINDRGPFIKGRIIDLSKKAAQKLGMLEKGTAKVRLKVL